MKKHIKRRPFSYVSDDQSQSKANNSQLIERIFLNRNIQSEEEREYSLKKMHSPVAMKGLEAGVALLVDALCNDWRICIVGDFDADGATSTALMKRSLDSFGFKFVHYLVPNRFDYGYGLTPEIVEIAAQSFGKDKTDLIVTVDNGISSIDGVDAAKKLGIKVLVTDHHLPGRVSPDADAIVNPNQHGCEFPSKNLAGVGVAFYLMSALRAKLRKINWFSDSGVQEPNLAELLDLVALGTVADVVPLDYNNRVLVAQGLARIRAGRCIPGIKAIFEVANRSMSRLVASDLGFVVGPRLNAAGRLDDMSLGIRCLLSQSDREAFNFARELDDLNRDRKLIETSMQKEALTVLEDFNSSDASLSDQMGICLYKEDWHQGVIGILASRIKDRFHRPTIVFAQSDDGSLKGSGRSVEGIHLRDVLDDIATGTPGLLTKFGGHAMAAGLSLDRSRLDEFQQAFCKAISRRLDGEDLVAELTTDGELRQSEFCLPSAQSIRDAGPWGQAFPEPQFDGKFRIVQQRIVGEKHLKMVLAANEFSGDVVDAIAFNVDTAVWPNLSCQWIRVVYKLDINEFRGKKSLQLIVDYIEEVSESD